MKSNAKRSKLAVIFLYLIGISSFLASTNYLVNTYIILQYQKGVEVSMDLKSNIAIIFSVIEVFYAVTYLLCIIFFILWFTRAYRNLQIVRPKSKFAYPYWTAAVVWFVPIWNIFGPYTIATNLFNKAEDYLISEDKMLRNPSYDTVKGVWWTLWILSSIFVRTGAYYSSNEPMSISGNIGAFVGFILSVVCALLAIQMIKNYSKMETMIYDIQTNDDSVLNALSNSELLDTRI